MNSHVDSLLASCREIESELVASSSVYAQQFESSAVPFDLMQRLESYSSLLAEVDEAVRGDSADRGSATLVVLEAEWQQSEALDRSNAILEHLSALKHARVEKFAPLLELQAGVRDLRARREPTTHSDRLTTAATLLDPTHPWNALALLTGLDGEPGDDAWERAKSVVREHLGDELATAAARGRLRLDVFEADEEIELAGPAESVSDVQTGRDTTEVQGSNVDRSTTPDDFPTVTDSRTLASWLLSTETIESRGENRLACSLLAERRAGVAHGWIALCECSRSNGDRFPRWLLQAIALTPRLSRSSGAISNRLSTIYRSVDASRNGVGKVSSATGQATDLLLRLATLRATLVAPESGAGRLLRTTRLGNGLEDLHNLTATIADFAERTGGLDLDRDRNDRATTETIAADAAAWIERATAETVRYSKGGPLHTTRHWTVRVPAARTDEQARHAWRDRADLLSTVHRLLGPVVTNDVSRRFEVEDGIQLIQRRFPEETRPPEIVTTAIDHATKWTREARGEHGRPRASEADIEMLRVSLSRYDDASLELKTIVENGTTFEERVAASLLLEEVESIRELLAAPHRVVGREPQPADVLNGELTALTGLTFDADGRPVNAERDACEERLLRSLAAGPPDWANLAESVIEREDWDVADRLLAIDTLPVEVRERLAHRFARRERERLDALVSPEVQGDATVAESATTFAGLEDDRGPASVQSSVDEPGDGEGWILDLFDDVDSFGAGT